MCTKRGLGSSPLKGKMPCQALFAICVVVCASYQVLVDDPRSHNVFSHSACSADRGVSVVVENGEVFSWASLPAAVKTLTVSSYFRIFWKFLFILK